MLSRDLIQTDAEWDKIVQSLHARISKLENALKQVDAIAVRHERGAAVKMQKVAREALHAQS